jgi:hypothetical protein
MALPQSFSVALATRFFPMDALSHCDQVVGFFCRCKHTAWCRLVANPQHAGASLNSQTVRQKLATSSLDREESVEMAACSDSASAIRDAQADLPIECPFVSEPLCTVLLKQMSDPIDVSRAQLPGRPDGLPSRRVPRHITARD